MQGSLQEKNLKEAARMFGEISYYKDSFVQAKVCNDAYEKEINVMPGKNKKQLRIGSFLSEKQNCVYNKLICKRNRRSLDKHCSPTGVAVKSKPDLHR